MTLCYSYEVSTSRFGTFVKQLFRWRGSIYNLLYRELIIYLCLYYIISATYRCLLNEDQKTTFEKICITCTRYADFVPITMVLGFYVSWVVTRWWGWYLAIGWPDRMSIFISTLVCGEDERSRIIRRTLIRYLNLANVLVLRKVSLVARKRFPELHHVKDAGFLTEEEMKLFTNMTPWTVDQSKLTKEYDTFWIPLQWFCTVCARARKDGRIHGDPQLTVLLEEVSKYRDTLMSMIFYDWISVPLVYTQVCTLAVYSYFLTCLLSRQYLDPSKGYKDYQIDLYFPFFTVLEFLFYAGWLKVAESLMSPLGEQTDHFEVNYIIDRNVVLGYLLGDTFHNKTPSLQKDEFWDTAPEIPHTLASAGLMDTAYVGSAETYQVPLDLYAEAPQRHESADAQNEMLKPRMSVAFVQHSIARQGRRFLSVFNPTLYRERRSIEQDADTISTGSEKLQGKSPIAVPLRNEVRFKDGTMLDTIYEIGPRTSSESLTEMDYRVEVSRF